MKPQLSSVSDAINSVESEITLAQKDNFDKWPTMGKCYGAALIAFDSWLEEVNYAKTFFADRITWMDSYLLNL